MKDKMSRVKKVSEITAVLSLCVIFFIALKFFTLPLFIVENKEVKGTSTAILNATGDAWVEQKNPNSNKDSVNIAKVGLEGVNQANRIYIKHDVSSIPSNATVTNAYINVRMFNAFSVSYCFGTPTTMTVAPVSGSWNETTITWANKPGNGGGINANLVCGANYENITVTSLVQGWVSGAANNGVVISGNESGSLWMRQIYTKNVTDPTLTVWYTTPDPQTPSSENTPSNTQSTPSPTATTNNPKTNPKTSFETETPVDLAIPTPALTSVFINLEEKKAPIEGNLEINQNDKLNIKGTGVVGSKTVVFFGEDAFETEVDSEGKWSLTIEKNILQDGEYLVQAQAQKDGKGSEKVKLFELKKSVLAATAKAEKKVNKYLLVIPTVVILILGVLIFLIFKKKKLSQKTKNPAH